MDAILQSLTQSVRQDVIELVHATKVEEPAVTEIEPPDYMHWGVPLGFASLAAAGALLVALGGVQTRVEDRMHHKDKGARKAKPVKRPLKPRPQPTPWQDRAT